MSEHEETTGPTIVLPPATLRPAPLPETAQRPPVPLPGAMNATALRALAMSLAKTPTRSTAHMAYGERVLGIEQMLSDLWRLTADDGLVAGAWALEFLGYGE